MKHRVRAAWAAKLDGKSTSSATKGRSPSSASRRRMTATVPGRVVIPALKGTAIQAFDIDPGPKPRMTQRDRWCKRPCVLRYKAYADALRLMGLSVPQRYSFLFLIPMPASWSHKRKAEMNGLPHEQRPDATNLAKAVEDIAMENDEGLWDARARTYWGYTGRLIVMSREDENRMDMGDGATCPRWALPPQPPSKERHGTLRRTWRG